MKTGEILAARFELGPLAGAGGMGRIYRAHDLSTQRSVAVKVLPGVRDEGSARFEREVQVLSELSHPRIVRYVAHGVTPSGDPWLAMEWLDGEDLARRLGRGPLSVRETLALGTAIAEALGYVHQHGIVHRDLKPGNVFLPQGDAGRATLLDFGIARSEVASALTQTRGILGTPGYMAPEQILRNTPIDPRADVFALGSLLSECLTGEPVFTGSNVLAVLAKIALESTPNLVEAFPDLPGPLGDLLERMLAKSPSQRPADGLAVAAALRELGQSGVDDAPEHPPRRPVALTGGEQRAVALLLIGGGAAFSDADAGIDASLRAEAARHGGVFVRLLTGAVAVVLTGPALVIDLAAQAARCALSVRAQLDDLTIALTVGRAEVAGPLPVGPAIDRAAALLATHSAAKEGARAGGIRLGDLEAGLLDAQFDLQSADGGYLLVGERGPGQQSRTLLGKPTPHVGRDAELTILGELLSRCVEEPAAQAVVVTAQAGAGKSRLAQELIARILERRPATSVWIGRGDPARTGSAFGLLSQALRSACELQDGEPLSLRQEKLRAQVTARGLPVGSQDDVGPIPEFLGELVGVPFSDEACLSLRAARRDVQQMNDQMFTAFARFLKAETAKGPLVFILEDLHWGDGSTVQFIDRVLLELRDDPLFVLALARPEINEVFPGLWHHRDAHEIRLRPLGRAALFQLVRHVLGAEVTAETLERLAEQSEGNAFYLEELIRWAAGSREGDLPESLVAMVHSRLTGLDEESRWLLRAASVYGETFWPAAVGALGSPERLPGLNDGLARLKAQELIVERGGSRFLGERELVFRHALLREGAYAMLTEDDRRLGHLLAAQWLEQRGEPDARVLAEHFARGGDGARAGAHYLRAAQRASVGSDTSSALTCIAGGLSLTAPEEIRRRLLGMSCELRAYDFEMAGSGLDEAQRLLADADPGTLPWTQALIGCLIGAVQTGARPVFAQAVAEALTAAFEPEATELGVMSLGFGACFADLAGDVDTGEQSAVRAETLARATTLMPTDAMPAAAVFGDIISASRSYYAHEDPWRGLCDARRALVGAQAIHHRRYTLGARMLVVANTFFLGAYSEALATASEPELPDHELGLSSSLRPFVLAWLQADLGAYDQARFWAERLLAAGVQRRLPLDEGRGHWILAEVLRRTGEHTRADKEIQAALSLLAVVCPLDHPGALATLANLRLAQGKFLDALAAAEAGMAAYRTMGACGLFRGSLLRLAHADSLAANGRETEARITLADAARALRAKSAKILDAEYREGFLNNVPENHRTLAAAGKLGSPKA